MCRPADPLLSHLHQVSFTDANTPWAGLPLYALLSVWFVPGWFMSSSRSRGSCLTSSGCKAERRPSQSDSPAEHSVSLCALLYFLSCPWRTGPCFTHKLPKQTPTPYQKRFVVCAQLAHSFWVHGCIRTMLGKWWWLWNHLLALLHYHGPAWPWHRRSQTRESEAVEDRGRWQRQDFLHALATPPSNKPCCF
jgi:hypothetical protein